MKLPKKTYRKLCDPKRSAKKQSKTLKEYFWRLSSVQRTRAIHELALNTKLSDRTRSSLIYQTEQIHTQESVRVLRSIVHDKSGSITLRDQALYSLSLMGDPLIHTDLAALLCDPTEDVLLRAEAAEKIGGLAIRRLEYLVVDILRRDEAPPEVLFWCLYACTSFPQSRQLIKVVKKYCKDTRLVETGMKGHVDGPATLASEAQWAHDHLRGIFREPDWMILPKQ